MYEKIAVCGSLSVLGQAFMQEVSDNELKPVAIMLPDLSLPAPLLAEKIDGCYAVCNMSGATFIARDDESYEHDIYCSRLMSIRAFVAAWSYCKNPPRVFVAVSNAMIYDEYEVHDDFSTAYGDTFPAEVGLMETKETLKLKQQMPNVRIIIARCGYIMNKENGLFALLRKTSRCGLSGMIDDGYQCLPLIHVDDAVRILFNIMVDVNCEGIYNITIPNMASLRELVNAFSEYVGHRQLSLPKSVLRVVANRVVTLLEQNCKVIPQRLQSIGINFKYPTINDIVNNLLKK